MNQDAPNVEVVRKLIKIFPAGAGMPSLSGNLPLHYCVSRARPSIPVIKALITAYPEAVRSGCEEGYLPLHRYLYRPIVDLDALRLLINYFPDALRATSGRNQTPLHVALDHHEPDALAVALLMEVCPAAVAVADTDRYLPLHLCLDCAEVSTFLSPSLNAFPHKYNSPMSCLLLYLHSILPSPTAQLRACAAAADGTPAGRLLRQQGRHASSAPASRRKLRPHARAQRQLQ